jgi:hypothetical protein
MSQSMFGSIVQEICGEMQLREAIVKDVFYLCPRRKNSDSDNGTNNLFS